ncbi:hypothetical protein ARALYDRAFT_910271 [Arabidopsis lyrata subsp. lyrata]|uniref:F-box associated beta-propeller type 3 domain-containing protein n=1 Tax=Arabidopsis lyrata subsp. lyrata TaxID=81972 RepID=D7M1I5_ARALL|nr:hypothetical protein ARALYDRAFT_910271 [Arabidopsis lyrata subsp. lyrata]
MTISDLVYYIRSRPVNGFVCCTRGFSIAMLYPTKETYTVEDQYKVLCVMIFRGYNANQRDIQQEHYVFTLSSQQKEWRKIEITQDITYITVHEGICMDGAIYYGDGRSGIDIFDVRSEKLELIQIPEGSDIAHFSALINYNGKLGGVEYDCLILWILEDAKKHKWSEMACPLAFEWSDLLGDRVTSNGEIHTGELMVVNPGLRSSKPFSVCYYDFNRERIRIRKVEVEGIADDEFRRFHGIGKRTREMLCFPGYVENIKFL